MSKKTEEETDQEKALKYLDQVEKDLKKVGGSPPAAPKRKRGKR